MECGRRLMAVCYMQPLKENLKIFDYFAKNYVPVIISSFILVAIADARH